MKADVFTKTIGKTHTIDVKAVCDKIDALPAAEKAKITKLNDAILEAIAKRIKIENHLLVAESLVVIIKHTEKTTLKQLKEAAGD